MTSLCVFLQLPGLMEGPPTACHTSQSQSILKGSAQIGPIITAQWSFPRHSALDLIYAPAIKYVHAPRHISGLPPPPPPIEPGGTYARSPSPEPPISGKGYTPLSLEKDIIVPPYIGYWLPLAKKKKQKTSGFSPEIFPRLQPKNTPPPLSRGWRREGHIQLFYINRIFPFYYQFCCAFSFPSLRFECLFPCLSSYYVLRFIFWFTHTDLAFKGFKLSDHTNLIIGVLWIRSTWVLYIVIEFSIYA